MCDVYACTEPSDEFLVARLANFQKGRSVPDRPFSYGASAIGLWFPLVTAFASPTGFPSLPEVDVRRRGGLERLYQSELGPLPEMGLLMRALGRLVPELRLNRLDGVTSGRGLAGYRMPTDLMVADLPEAEGSLHDPQGPCAGACCPTRPTKGAMNRRRRRCTRSMRHPFASGSPWDRAQVPPSSASETRQR